MSGQEPSPHNRVFDLLVNGDGDVEGLLAYAYYKRHKRSWLFEFRDTLKREPSGAEAASFVNGACVADQLDRYRQQAEKALIAYATVYVDGARGEIEQGAVAGRIEAAAKRIEAASGFLPQLKVAVASTIVTTAILVILAIGVRLLGIDLIDAVSKLSE